MDPARPPPTPTAPPGSPEALDGGCLCSVLLNRLAGENAGQGFVNPLCPVHRPVDADPALPPASLEPSRRPGP